VSDGANAAAARGWRRPIITSIAPDQEDCSNPSSPGGTEDVQITGICFTIPDMTTANVEDSCGITEAYFATNPDGSGTRIDLSNVRPVANNEISATVPVTTLESNIPYYVFVVRCDGATSTSYPNALGYNVTFTCRPGAAQQPAPAITSCRLQRISGGRFVLQVIGTNLRAGTGVLRLNGTVCPRAKFPPRFVGSDGFTTRVDCAGGVKRLLPATLTFTNPDGQTSAGFSCNF
jgi:hypothetical protein